MHTPPNRPGKVLVIAASTRTGSINQALARRIAAQLDTTASAASASPGRGGGANGVAMVRTWLSNMGIEIAERTLSVDEATIAANGDLIGLGDDELARFVRQAVLERSAA